MLRIAVAVVLFLTGATYAAGPGPEDALAACAIGLSAVLMHQGADIDTAFNVAWAECEPLKAQVAAENDGEDFDGLDGIIEFVYITLHDIAD